MARAEEPLVVLAIALFFSWTSGSAAAPSKHCKSTQTAHVAVHTTEHRLYLCDAGEEVLSFDVRLGRKGVGKTREGDDKTPVGTYSLGRPRASQRYGTFIPIGFPTPEQRRQGYTGGAVGVHGPDRRVRWLGRLVNTFDSTNGCVGIATDEEMASIAEWITRTHARQIVLSIL